MTAMTASLACPVYADTKSDIAAAKSQQSQTQSALNQAQNQISSMKNKKQGLESYLTNLNAQMKTLSRDLTELNDKIDKKEVEIETTKGAVARAKYQVSEQKKAMSSRIQYMYENDGTDNFLISLLDSKDVTEVLNRAEEHSEITAYDRQQLREYQESCDIVAAQEATLEEEQKKLVSLKSESESKQAQVKELAENTNRQIKSYTDSISKQEMQASALSKQISQQQENLKKLEAKAAAEEAARQKAAAEAARVAKLAQQKAAQEKAAQAAKAAAAKKAAEAAQNAKVKSLIKGTSTYSARQEQPAKSSAPQSTAKAASSSAGTASASSTSGKKYLGRFKLTSYCPCAKCCGRANQPTASGVMPQAGRTVAMAGVPFGTKLMINGHIYTVEDRGTPYGHVDIFCNSHSAALQFGMSYADVYQV